MYRLISCTTVSTGQMRRHWILFCKWEGGFPRSLSAFTISLSHLTKWCFSSCPKLEQEKKNESNWLRPVKGPRTHWSSSDTSEWGFFCQEGANGCCVGWQVAGNTFNFHSIQLNKEKWRDIVQGPSILALLVFWARYSLPWGQFHELGCFAISLASTQWMPPHCDNCVVSLGR